MTRAYGRTRANAISASRNGAGTLVRLGARELTIFVAEIAAVFFAAIPKTF
jgi:hypothetical protein